MYVQYNIVQVSFSGQSGPTNTLEKRYVFWILSSMNFDMKRFVYFFRAILPLLQHLSLFLLLLLHTSCSGHSWETIKNALWYWPSRAAPGRRLTNAVPLSRAVCVSDSRQQVDPLELYVLMNKIWTKFFRVFAWKCNTNMQRWNSQSIWTNVNALQSLRNSGQVWLVTTGWQGSTPLPPTGFLSHPISTQTHPELYVIGIPETLPAEVHSKSLSMDAGKHLLTAFIPLNASSTLIPSGVEVHICSGNGS